MNILQVEGQPSVTDVVAVEAIVFSYSLNELCGLSLLWLISSLKRAIPLCTVLLWKEVNNFKLLCTRAWILLWHFMYYIIAQISVEYFLVTGLKWKDISFTVMDIFKVLGWLNSGGDVTSAWCVGKVQSLGARTWNEEAIWENCT